MADPYRLLVHPDLGRQLQELAAAAKEDPNGPEATEFAAVKDGLNALRHGREDRLDGKQLHSIVDKYGDISDCAEVKVPVVREFAPNGHEFGPSHRLTYREFDGTAEDPTPVREAIAFEPRKDGKSFVVTAARLGRPVGVTLEQLGQTQSQQSQTQQAQPQQVRTQQRQQSQRTQQAQRSTMPVRRPLPHELTEAARAASAREVSGSAAGQGNQPPASSSTGAEAKDPVIAQRLAAMAFSSPATTARQVGQAASPARPATRRDAARGRNDSGTDASRS